MFAMIQELKARVAALEARLAALEGKESKASTCPTVLRGTPATLTVPGKSHSGLSPSF
jgi:hypothetical protein